jgi:mannose-6-phosphate isomerase-like protein (cupin superfamily)
MSSTLAAPAATSIAETLAFSMRNLPLLDDGATMEPLGIAPALWAHSKVYSTGGENALHSHDIEDHVFLVLQGEAFFAFGDGSTRTVREFEGVMVPRGTLYKFNSVPEKGNLVMFRVGGGNIKDSSDLDPRFKIPREALQSRKDPSGLDAKGDATRNGTAARTTVYRDGAFFAPD